ncbi:MAG: hypothetical protein H6644_12320 [Caldilineaceae bacterium]|nr:hypothetical protein [Caldilineaceae bacterium]
MASPKLRRVNQPTPTTASSAMRLCCTHSATNAPSASGLALFWASSMVVRLPRPKPSVTSRLMMISMDMANATAWTGLAGSSLVTAAAARRTGGSNKIIPTSDGSHKPSPNIPTESRLIPASARPSTSRSSGCCCSMGPAACKPTPNKMPNR